MTDRYVVAGNPVAHSKSPLIHGLFAAQTGQDIDYRRLLVAHGQFAAVARRFFAEGGCGMNITVPFKGEAAALADTLSERARQAGAVNTLSTGAAGALQGENTDGCGLLRDLRQNLGWEIEGARVLLLGAGGAARGVLGPLLEEQPGELVIANRTVSRALELAQLFGQAGARIHGCAPDQLDGRFDVLINATSAGLDGGMPVLTPSLLGARGRCYDMVYGDKPTPFLRWAVDNGAAACADGLGMLVEQAAESFAIWRGVRPATAPVIAQLRSGITLHPARDATDIAHAARLFREYQAWLGADLCFQGFEQELASLPGAYAPPRGALLLATANELPFACVAMRPLDQDCCEMKRLYVPGTWRGAGLGRRLALAVIEAARAAGYARMRLDTLERLREANSLYAQLGFRRCEPYYANPLEGVVFWELDLRRGNP